MKRSNLHYHSKEATPLVSHERGFSLIVVITVMILLSLIAVGLLSLSATTIRATGADRAKLEARANARLALQIAVGELQRTIGDDRRITANGDIQGSSGNPHAMGVWESWSPKLTDNPTGQGLNYEGEKNSRFLRWMVSGPEDEVERLDYVGSGSSPSSVSLFGEDSDGFGLAGEMVSLNTGAGGYAWAVSQENTKAKINVAGPELDQLIREDVLNDTLQAQPRPNVESEFFRQPEENWNARASKVINLKQAELDPKLTNGQPARRASADFSATSAGLLTNVVDGGLKVDLSLGFEMEESDFASASWSGGESGSLDNPFHAKGEKDFTTPGSYREQRPLYQPLSDTGSFQSPQEFWPASVQHEFPVTAVPTFHTLRNFYRIPHHLYRSGKGFTVFERENDHVAAVGASTPGNFYPPPSATVRGQQTQTGIRPVMDRVMFLVSGGMNSLDELRLIITPIITLWNPYNVALEIEGSVAHVWLDLPYTFEWRTFNARGRVVARESMYTSGLMSNQFLAQNHGRSVDPYFFAAITENGQPLSFQGGNPIRFEPGEVRVFAPAERSLKSFEVDGSVRDRTIFLRPVDSLAQFSTKGGFSVPTRNDRRNEGFVRKLKPDQSAQLIFSAIPDEDYPFYISLEDATRAKGTSPTIETRGQAIADILTNTFSKSGNTVNFETPRVPYSQLSADAVPIGVIESYHRVANEGSQSLAEHADLVFTGNPRQAWMNSFITKANFKTGPQYETRMRQVSDFSGVLQTANGGRSAYYGGTQDPTGGRTHLSFFEVPTAPMLSLAGFQHCDLSSTPYAPANQFGNSWASAYVSRNRVSDSPLEVDHCYLTNEALWDSTFFSGATPEVTTGSATGSTSIWASETTSIRTPIEDVLKEFFENPDENPLRNPRMRLAEKPSSSERDDLASEMAEPAGCLKLAGELLVDGAFNINSTSVAAWKAVLGGLRGATFEVEENRVSVSPDTTPFPRFRDPVGVENDVWHGYRTLTEPELDALAEGIVAQVRARGPFLSLGEFVNRRVTGDEAGLKGAIQAAIDGDSTGTNINGTAEMTKFSTRNYERSSRSNIVPSDTGVGIPGYLTQADVLTPLAPIITVRSDTFTIRSYGDSRDKSGRIAAQSWLEATVQRVPEFVDPADPKHLPVDELNEINTRFGRRLRVTSLRYLSTAEIEDLQNSTTI